MIEIELTQGKVALIDDEDFDLVRQYRWCAVCCSNNFYARAHKKVSGGVYEKVYMHRLVIGAPLGQYVDHINRNGLDNRKENLRFCTNSQNQGNQKPWVKRGGKSCSSLYKGVSWQKDLEKWRSQIQCNKKHFHIGMFTLEEDAARAYDKKARELFGEFAKLNFEEVI